MICREFGQRPSSIIDTYDELSHMEKIVLDIKVLNARSAEGEKTMDIDEVNDYLKNIQDKRNKTIGGMI